MLDAKADGEGLGLEEYAPLLQHAQRVAGAVPQRQHHVATVQRFAVGQHHAFDLAILDEQVGDLALEAHFTAQRDDLLAHRGHHAGQAKGADVRLAHEEDFCRRAGAHELVHHLAAVELRVLDLAVELAVGEQARAALAKLHIGFGRQRVLLPQRPGVAGATAHVAAAFQHDGLEAHLRQQQRREQAAGTKAHDQRTFLEQCWRLRHRVIGRVRRDAHLSIARRSAAAPRLHRAR